MLNFYQMEQSINTIMQKSNIPGLALAIVQEHKLTYAKGFGVTSVEDGGLPVTPETLFRIGSITKPLTGTAIMRLVEASKLDLDTPIKTYIDGFRLSDPESIEQVTLRMLLSHTAGLPTDGQHFGQRAPQGLEISIREEIPTYALIAPPNRVMSYSNLGVNIAGYIGHMANKKTLISIGFPSLTKPAPYIYVNCFIYKRTELTTTPDPDKWKSYEDIYVRKEHDTYTVRLVENELRIYSDETAP